MPMISEDYRKANAQLHQDNPNYGTSSGRWAPLVREIIDAGGISSVLDYGAGKQLLGRALGEMPGVAFSAYDPAIPEIAAEPSPADFLVCTDVLEHIEPVHLNAVLRHMASLTRQRAFVVISTKASSKTLRDGRNAHLIIKDGSWWREKLARHFRIGWWQEAPTASIAYGEILPREGRKFLADKRVRLQMRPEWEHMIGSIRAQNHRYADAWGRLNSFSMWQGVGDTRADMQIVTGLLEFAPDIEDELRAIVKSAAKAVLLMVPVDAEMTEAFWRRCFTRHLRLGDWQTDIVDGQKRLVCCGSPMVGVAGVTAIGAVDSGERWEQVKAAAKAVGGRIAPAPSHHRKAIIACYGPSLRDTMAVIAEEAASGESDVITVSGSHDMLIAAGITPRYHIECDPRPHKTDNIAAGNHGVQYLIASSVHPNYLEKLVGHDVRLWHVSTPEHNTRLIDELHESPDTVISGGGSVGLRSIPLLYTLGYREFHIHGMDCSFRISLEGEIAQWAGKHAGKRQDECEVQCGNRLFTSSPVLLTYATGFFELLQASQDITIRLYGDGLLQSMCKLYDGLEQVSAVKAVSPSEQHKKAV